MATINKILSFLESKYPTKEAEKWDNVGLQFGNKRQNVKNILVALDLTTEVFDEALKKGSELIITHHPFLWEETIEENIENSPYKKDLIERIKHIKLGVYAMHTNYDAGKDGTVHQVIDTLGWTEVETIKRVKHGLIANTNKLKLNEIKKLLEDKLNVTLLHSNAKGEYFQKIAIFPGSGDIKDILAAKEANADLIITSDVKWSDWVTMKEHDINVLQVSHDIEDVFTDHIHEVLAKKFKDIKVEKLKRT